MLTRISANVLRDLGLLLIRCALAAVFFYHGGQKLFGWWDGGGLGGFAAFLQELKIPYPAYAAVLAAAAEFFGAICLLIGFGMRFAIVPMVATMAVAIAFVHPHQFGQQMDGMEYPLTLAVVLVGLLLTGPGMFGLHSLRIGPWLARRQAIRTLTEIHYANQGN